MCQPNKLKQFGTPCVGSDIGPHVFNLARRVTQTHKVGAKNDIISDVYIYIYIYI